MALMCRVLGVGTSSFYDWQARRTKPSARSVADAEWTEKIKAIHTMSRASYGSPRVWSSFASATACAAPASGSSG